MEGSSSNRIVTSESSDDEDSYDIMPEDFKWTLPRQKKLLVHMRTKIPVGLNKHLNMLLLRDQLVKEFKLKIPTSYLWDYLNTLWDLEGADKLRPIQLDLSLEPLSLSDEYAEFISETIKFTRNEHLKKEILHEKQLKKEMKDFKDTPTSNSMSAGDSEDGLEETVHPLKLLESTPFKTVDISSEEVSSTLCTNEKPEKKEVDDLSNKKKSLCLNTKSDDFNKSNDLKMLGKKSLNQSKDSENNAKMPMKRGRKKKSCNLSESSFSSDNSKQLISSEKSSTCITASECLSRSVAPEILRGKAPKRSIKSETPSRKSNLHSGDKNQKIKQGLKKASTKHVNSGLPESKSKPKYSLLNKTKTNTSKSKQRNRVSSDSLVMQQFDLVPLGRRSCTNKDENSN